MIFIFMAFSQLLTVLVVATLFLATIDLTNCHVVKGKVSCLDCTHNYDFSGIKVSVKCARIKKVVVTTTEDDGSFSAELPLQYSSPSSNCLAKLLGGSTQLYVSRKNTVSEILKTNDPTTYTVSTPLSFSTSCPRSIKCGASNMFGQSKTVDMPMIPPGLGLAPTSFYYPPFLPIIGIP